MKKSPRIAIAGAGIYGSTIAIRLAEAGYRVFLYDPLGVMQAASAINQYRVHHGYHYPRSDDTIEEITESRREFIDTFFPAIISNTRNYYAIPFRDSLTSTERFVEVMNRHRLPYVEKRPEWMNFDYIDMCWQVDEQIYDPIELRNIIIDRLRTYQVNFIKAALTEDIHSDYDFVIYATYGLSGSNMKVFDNSKFQIAEKVLIQLPIQLRHISLVVVDGPFTAFDPYGNSGFSLFGSAKLTNHWSTHDEKEAVPNEFASMMNRPKFEPTAITRFEQMRMECALAVPEARGASYEGSRFTLRVIEDNPMKDRRILHIRKSEPHVFHVFSSKVVCAVKASRMILEMVARGE